jgi:hypothetical protein
MSSRRAASTGPGSVVATGAGVMIEDPDELAVIRTFGTRIVGRAARPECCTYGCAGMGSPVAS